MVNTRKWRTASALKRKYNIALAILLLTPFTMIGQSLYAPKEFEIVEKYNFKIHESLESETPVTEYKSQLIIPKFKHEAYFCKLEHKHEVKNKWAMKFRLGSLDYANYLEGKGNFR